MLDLLSSFEALPTPSVAGLPGGARFSAAPIDGYELHRLGKDFSGTPSLLIYVTDAPGMGWPAPIALENLTVQHDVECRIAHPNGELEQGRFTVVRCMGNDRALQGYFLRAAATIVTLLGEAPSHADVTAAIERLVELFRAMSTASRKSVQGLWAELFLIARSLRPDTLVAAWHVLPDDRYDFSGGGQRIEVKSASGRVRAHHFSLEQLLPPTGVTALIASTFVERAGAGISVLDLATEVRERISHDPDLLLHVDRIVTATLGQNWRYAQEQRFDRELAENSIAFFSPDSIPSVDPSVPPGVSDVHFRVDLTALEPVNTKEYRVQGGLFALTLRH
jgi:hypothetical protein